MKKCFFVILAIVSLYFFIIWSLHSNSNSIRNLPGITIAPFAILPSVLGFLLGFLFNMEALKSSKDVIGSTLAIINLCGFFLAFSSTLISLFLFKNCCGFPSGGW